MTKWNKIEECAIESLRSQHFDSLAIAHLDFSDNKFKSFEVHTSNEYKGERTYFDLASVSKPLNLSSVFLKSSKLFSDEMILLLNHRAGLPAGGRLSKHNWKDEINSYQIKESKTLYSDYSALRLMLELEKKSSKALKDISNYYWDKELIHWNDLTDSHVSNKTGIRNGKEIQGAVHDDNAFYMNEFLSHAGMFATIDGLSKSILNLNKEAGLLKQMSNSWEESPDKGQWFVNGWDTILDPENSLAGKGCGKKTFGHLGFVGTSVWIDPELKKGHIILTNGTQSFWYDRVGRNDLRRSLGELLWQLS
jgi:CubicO group peptidase (beta-lactamase class C family)